MVILFDAVAFTVADNYFPSLKFSNRPQTHQNLNYLHIIRRFSLHFARFLPAPLPEDPHQLPKIPAQKILAIRTHLIPAHVRLNANQGHFRPGISL